MGAAGQEQGRVGVPEIVLAYIAYAGTLGQWFKAPVYYVLGVQKVPFEGSNASP